MAIEIWVFWALFNTQRGGGVSEEGWGAGLVAGTSLVICVPPGEALLQAGESSVILIQVQGGVD